MHIKTKPQTKNKKEQQTNKTSTIALIFGDSPRTGGRAAARAAQARRAPGRRPPCWSLARVRVRACVATIIDFAVFVCVFFVCNKSKQY